MRIMNKNVEENPNDYIATIYINGMHGRMLRLPSTVKNKEILIVYGRNQNLEQLFYLAKELNKYGNVTIPDIPGFGGMQSFYKIGEKPILDNLADYLAAFIKLRYSRRKVTIFGLGFGFIVVTRMLQKYPNLMKKINILINYGGFIHKDAIILDRGTYVLMHYSADILSWRLPAWSLKYFFLKPYLMSWIYSRSSNNSSYNLEEINQSDLRTFLKATSIMLKLDLSDHQINLTVYNIPIKQDWLDEQLVEQHLNVVYQKVRVFNPMTNKNNHSKVSGAHSTMEIPASLKRLLAKNN